MKKATIKYYLLSLLAIFTFNTAIAQNSTADFIATWGKFDNWQVRQIKESGIIGGNTKLLYVIANGDTIKGAIPYNNPPQNVWSTSNVLAIVKGITKTSCTVFPEKRNNGYCARMETRLERVRVLGIIDMQVLAAGTLFLGKMLEPITGTKDPQSKLKAGISFTDKPTGISFDYKVTVGNNRIKSSGFGSKKQLGDADYAECIVMLQKRWEDAQGNIYSKRVGTGYYRFMKSTFSWTNNFIVPINYGDITNENFYKPYMRLIPEDLSNYTVNSKGKSVPIKEVGWGTKDEKPTHIIIRFSSSHGEAYVGDITNKLWVDNVKLLY
ncbi:MAG: PCMD domain-containing protein [Bacteroidales bacterium]